MYPYSRFNKNLNLNLRMSHNFKAATLLRLQKYNKAASPKWGWLPRMRLPQYNDAASIQWGFLTTIWLPHNNLAASQSWGYLIKLTQNNEVTSNQYSYLTTINLPHNWVFLTTLRITPNIRIASQQWRQWPGFCMASQLRQPIRYK